MGNFINYATGKFYDLLCTPDFSIKYLRDYCNFKHEFNKELVNIDWPCIVNETAGTEISYQRFLKKLEEILNYMAPSWKMTQKEIRLEKRPRIMQELLVSMQVNDNLCEQIAFKKGPVEKASQLYKHYHNMIVNLQ